MNQKKINVNLAIKLYRDEKNTLEAVSKIVGCSVGTLVTRLREYGITIRSSGEFRQKATLEQLKHDYETLGLSTIEIAKKYNMNESSVYGRLKDNGVQIRTRKEAVNRQIPLSEHPKICDLYINDKTQNCGKIAKLYSVHKTTIANILRNNGIILEKSIGERNPSFKGGITPLHTRIRHCEKGEFWKRACLERDEYKCKITGETKDLQVHHFPRTFSEIFEDFLRLYPDLRPIDNSDQLFELSQNYEPFWDISNGITVCNSVHKRLHTNNGITDEEIIALHKQGWSCEKISKYFGKSKGFARSRLLSLGIKLRDVGYYNEQRNTITEDISKSVLEAYIDNKTTRSICKKFNISNGTLYRILEKNNIVPGNRKYDQRSDAIKQAERVIELNAAGVTIEEIAKIYEVSDTTIRNILKIN